MLYDNTRAININKNLVQQNKTKYIDIKHHFFRELVEQGVLDLEYVTTQAIGGHRYQASRCCEVRSTPAYLGDMWSLNISHA